MPLQKLNRTLLGFTTVLLVEGNLTRNKMLHAIKSAFSDGLHSDLDEIWYVSTWGNHIGNFTQLPKWGENKNVG
jgi:formate/nitrite transporter FocA (FNT family)